MFKKNDKLELEIIDVTEKGIGVAKKENLVFFVIGAVTGDIVEALILKVTKNIIFAKTLKILKFSKYREKHDVSVHEKCGACTLFNLNYQKQIEFKKKTVENNLKKIAKIGVEIEDIIQSVDKTNYRNKTIYPLALKNNEIIYGSYSINSHNIINNRYCLIQNKRVDDLMYNIAKLIKKYNISIYDENINKGLLRNVYIRISNYTKEISLTFVINADKIDNNFILECKDLENITSISININKQKSNTILTDNTMFLYGKHYIEEKIGDIVLRIHPNSFFQVNTKTCELLYKKIVEFANFSKEDKVLDLFSGIGSISLFISKFVKEVKGVEIVDFATKNAIENMKLNNISNAKFETKDANKIKYELNHFDILIVDPPRKGLEKELIEEINKSNINKMVYVSCDSATLSRDLEILKNNFEIKKIALVDMFPQTHHVETVVLLSKLKSTNYITVDLNTDELDLTSAESSATYMQVKEYILEKYKTKVSTLNISQIKKKYGITTSKNYNLSKKENHKVPNCTPEKEEMIVDAFKHFQMI